MNKLRADFRWGASTAPRQTEGGSVNSDWVPLLVTENGTATPDDELRIAYTLEALRHLRQAVADGVDVRGYLRWSLLYNFEWRHWDPTFGLIAVDRHTFERIPKPSLAWLGDTPRAARTQTQSISESRS